MTDTTTTETNPGLFDLDAIRARAAAATPAPWSLDYEGPDYEAGTSAYPESLNGPENTAAKHASAHWRDNWGHSISEISELTDADAEFIAAAREDVPALLAEVDRLRGALAEVAKHQEDMADSLDDSITHEQIHEQLLIGMRAARDARG